MKAGSVPTHRDDLGNRWIVEHHEPGQRAIKAARDLRIKDPALPHEVLLGRPPDQPNWSEFEALVARERPDAERLRQIYGANLIRKHLRKEWTT